MQCNGNETNIVCLCMRRVQYIKSRMLLIFAVVVAAEIVSFFVCCYFGVDVWHGACIACNFVCKVGKTMETRKKKNTTCALCNCFHYDFSLAFRIAAMDGDDVRHHGDDIQHPNLRSALNIRLWFGLVSRLQWKLIIFSCVALLSSGDGNDIVNKANMQKAQFIIAIHQWRERDSSVGHRLLPKTQFEWTDQRSRIQDTIVFISVDALVASRQMASNMIASVSCCSSNVCSPKFLIFISFRIHILLPVSHCFGWFLVNSYATPLNICDNFKIEQISLFSSPALPHSPASYYMSI